MWSASAEPFRQQSPFGVLAQLARASAGILDGEAPRSREIKLKARVARHAASAHVSWVADGLAEIAGSGRVGTTDLGDVWSTFVTAECAVHPLILVVEDLQWIDGPSLRLLERTCADLRNVPLLLVLVERTEADAPPRSWRNVQSVELPVGELPRAEMEKLVVHLVGDAVKDRTGVLVEQSRGNVRALLDAVRDADGATRNEPERALRRFARLGADAQRLLAIGSVFGLHFLPGVVARFAGRHGDAFVTSRPLDELLREELVHEAPRGQFPGEPEYVFRDVSLWNASGTALPAEEAQAAHKYVARWLEDAGEPDTQRLAEHYRAAAKRRRRTGSACSRERCARAPDSAARRPTRSGLAVTVRHACSRGRPQTGRFSVATRWPRPCSRSCSCRSLRPAPPRSIARRAGAHVRVLPEVRRSDAGDLAARLASHLALHVRAAISPDEAARYAAHVFAARAGVERQLRRRPVHPRPRLVHPPRDGDGRRVLRRRRRLRCAGRARRARAAGADRSSSARGLAARAHRPPPALVRPRGAHVFTPGNEVSSKGGDVHYDVEGLTPEQLERRADAYSFVLMLQPCAVGGGLRLHDRRYAGDPYARAADEATPSEIIDLRGRATSSSSTATGCTRSSRSPATAPACRPPSTSPARSGGGAFEAWF